MEKQLALHETLEVHELLTLKNVSLTKTTMMAPLVQDEHLKTILENEISQGSSAIERLEKFLSKREGH